MKWILAAALALAMTGAAHAETIRLPSNFPRAAVRDYCAAAVDSFESMTFAASGLNGGAGPVEWRCVQGAVYGCPAGADGINCSSASIPPRKQTSGSGRAKGVLHARLRMTNCRAMDFPFSLASGFLGPRLKRTPSPILKPTPRN